MAFKKGNQLAKGKGRPQGSSDKKNLEIKEMLIGALEHHNGVEYFIVQAIENPVAFMALIGKLLPKDVNVNGKIQHSLATEPVPEFNRWLVSIATARAAEKKQITLPH